MPRGFAAAFSWPSSRATAVTRPSDHGSETVTSWPRARSSSIASSPSLRLDGERAEPGLSREERAREVIGVELRRVDRRLQVEPEVDVAEEHVQRPLVLLVAARACRRRGTALLHGERGPETASCAAACGARATTAAPPPARTSARASRAASRAPGMVGEPSSQPPLGVAETRLPKRSATSTWTVSPAIVGSPEPSVASASTSRGIRPRPGRSSNEAVLGDEPAALVVVLLREEPVERDVGVAVQRVAVGERELRALGDGVDELARGSCPRGRSRRGAPAAGGRPAPVPTARSCRRCSRRTRRCWAARGSRATRPGRRRSASRRWRS